MSRWRVQVKVTEVYELEAVMASDVVLFSGGMDSAAVLWHFAPEDAVPLFVDYGQSHLAAERAAALRIVGGDRLRQVAITIPWRASLLTGGSTSPVVPNRNAILASIGAAQAAAGGTVWIGCCAADAEVFADCRPDFIAALSRATELACGVRVRAPLVNMTKADIVDLVGADRLAATWSCYQPQSAGARAPLPCGECGACRARAGGGL